MSKKALILTYEKYQDHEVIYPYYRVQEEGFDVDIMSNINGKIFGILGTYMESTRTVSELDNQNSFYSILDEYDFLVIPGGVKSLEKLNNSWNTGFANYSLLGPRLGTFYNHIPWRQKLFWRQQIFWLPNEQI